jgi:transcription-repair coupling factor (superfamily II helicase)
MLDELMDRFGEPPRSVRDLLKAALLKSRAHECFLTDLSQQGEEIRFSMYDRAPVKGEKIVGFMKACRGRMRFVAGKNPCFSYTIMHRSGKTEDILDTVDGLLREMKEHLFPAVSGECGPEADFKSAVNCDGGL